MEKKAIRAHVRYWNLRRQVGVNRGDLSDDAVQELIAEGALGGETDEELPPLDRDAQGAFELYGLVRDQVRIEQWRERRQKAGKDHQDEEGYEDYLITRRILDLVAVVALLPFFPELEAREAMADVQLIHRLREGEVIDVRLPDWMQSGEIAGADQREWPAEQLEQLGARLA